MIDLPSGSDPLATCLLDLHAILGADIPLIVGGGYGLYLKQAESTHSGERTLFDANLLPDNRATQDIDLFLRAEVVVNGESMKAVRDALDRLGFTAVRGSEYMQFAKAVAPAGQIKIDLLVGPLGELFDASKVKRDERRVRPRSFGELHAHPLDEAVAIEEHLRAISLRGARSDGAVHTATVHVPQAFTYLLMKLLAFRDRANDTSKGLASHHALDIYRIIALTTKEEGEIARQLTAQHASETKVVEATTVAKENFAANDALGILRMREHPLFSRHMDIPRFMAELAAILPVSARALIPARSRPGLANHLRCSQSRWEVDASGCGIASTTDS